MIKRVVDILGALFFLILCAPILILIAIFIRLDSNGPVLFRQVRMGQGFHPFERYKFRTMIYEKSHKLDVSGIEGGLDRFTRIGQVLCRFKLDELPQLFNVLKGEMSLVGPRPEIPYYVDKFRTEYQEILTVRPGLIDLAFLTYNDDLTLLGKPGVKPPISRDRYIGETLPEKTRLAKLYLEHASLLFDLAVIAQTFLKLLGLRSVLLKMGESQSTTEFGLLGDSVAFKWILRHRRVFVIFLDLGLIVLANYLAFWLRFDGHIPTKSFLLFTNALPFLIAIRGFSFVLFRLNEGLWRYVSIWDVKKIFVGVVSGTIVFYGIIAWVFGTTGYPRSVYIIDTILLIGFLVGIRLAVRLFRERKILSRMKRVLVIGAGDAGAKIVREMQTHPSCSYVPIGFIDDDPSKLGKRIHGVKVLATRHGLVTLIPTLQLEEVLVALPGVNPAIVRDITTILSPFTLPIKTLPKLEDILEGKVSIHQIRALEIEDLLQRPSVNLSPEPVAKLIEGKRVFVTGAGGSIGSELCRQIVAFNPKSLILYERHENSLYTIESELTDIGYAMIIHPVLGDVADVSRLGQTVEKYRPDIIFHAAAHKHVPLMEINPGEAFKNNVLGTRLVAEAAIQYGVEHFVLISTDKAVNPSSVMGATKRAAELVIQGLAKQCSTCFLTVRFGNVLGSNGSVVPRFQRQINLGGPVTVTHPEVRRYFMSIPEAVGLVLQATTLGEQGAIYLLEMGEQIKLVDLARNLIKLSGHVPDKEIRIEFVGLRPGEKLEEELVGQAEDALPSAINGILKVRSTISSDSRFLDRVSELGEMSMKNDPQRIIKNLQTLVPAFSQKQIMEDPLLTFSKPPIHDRSSPTEKKRILIIDDDLVARNSVREFLEFHGFNCVVADHGAMALEWLKSEHADLIITDNRMPIMNGFEFLERLKPKEQVPHQHVMVLSGHLNEQDKDRVIKAGACAVFEKPGDFSQILPTISQILESS
ncbi:MAG: hypothetical protein NPIRA02_40890 [Nitrospirales bacterium]|nr:MAG: hypothetical protein NPIRA02_40890 [Nitrospirales bacterium]